MPLQVQFAGEEYNLRVLQLEPGPAVSVIDTDIAADVGPSIETEGYLRAQAEAAAREAERQRQQQEQAEREAAAVSVTSCKWSCCTGMQPRGGMVYYQRSAQPYCQAIVPGWLCPSPPLSTAFY